MAQMEDSFNGSWKPNKKLIRHSVWCHSCKSESGITNDELRITKRDLSCMMCGKICVRVPERVDFLDLTSPASESDAGENITKTTE
jgi:hypothetical protein